MADHLPEIVISPHGRPQIIRYSLLHILKCDRLSGNYPWSLERFRNRNNPSGKLLTGF
jgi:hypothetical protein